MRVFNTNDLIWRGDELFRRGARHPILRIEQDTVYPVMWRIRKRDGTLTGMLNRTRAKDAALSAALRHLQHQETPTEGAGCDPKSGPTSTILEAAE